MIDELCSSEESEHSSTIIQKILEDEKKEELRDSKFENLFNHENDNMLAFEKPKERQVLSSIDRNKLKRIQTF